MESRILDIKYRKPREKGTVTKRVVFWIVLVIFCLYALTLLVPFVWMLLNSFRTAQEFVRQPFALDFSNGFKNYADVLFKYKYKQTNVITMFGLSLLVSVVGTLISTLSCCVGAYVVAKYKFMGRNFIYNLVIISMTIPLVGTLPAQYKLMRSMGLNNSIFGVWFLYSGGMGFGFLFLYSFFKNISWSYAEAAFIDGASDFKVFYKIMVPMAMPALTAITVMGFIGLWNDYQTPSLYMRNMPTIAVGLNGLSEQIKYDLSGYTAMFALIILALTPIIIIFVAFQKTILNNTMSGGLKG